MFLFSLLFLRISAFTGEWCRGCDEWHPVSKIPTGSQISDAMSGLDVCSQVLPFRSWTKNMVEYYSFRGLPFRTTHAQRLGKSNDTSTASLDCEAPDPEYNDDIWTIGPYKMSCPKDHWLVIVYEQRSPFYNTQIEAPKQPEDVDNPLLCALQEGSAKRNVRRRERECLDVEPSKGRSFILLAWSTADGIDSAEKEVVSDYFEFIERREDDDSDKPIRVLRVEERTAFYVRPSSVVNTKWMFCYQSREKFTTVLRVAAIRAW